MTSENAKAVAREVMDAVRKGKKVNKGEIIRKHGYTRAVSIMPQKVTDTKSYQEEIMPFVRKCERERDRLIAEMEKRDLTDVQYKDMNDCIDKLTKNIQLLSGGKTSNEKISFEWDED